MIEVNGVYYGIENFENLEKISRIIKKLKRKYKEKFKKDPDEYLMTIDFLPFVDSIASMLWYCLEKNKTIEEAMILFWNSEKFRENAKFRLVRDYRRYPS